MSEELCSLSSKWWGVFTDLQGKNEHEHKYEFNKALLAVLTQEEKEYLLSDEADDWWKKTITPYLLTEALEEEMLS